MPQDAIFRLWLFGFRALSLGCLLMGSLGTLAFAVVAFLPGQRVVPNLFAAAMAGLIALVGKKGLAIRSRADLDRDRSALSARRDSFERWINRE
jgi:hypothetical protein